MENTLENKAKFFAQYWGQRIIKNKFTNQISIVNGFLENLDENYYLELNHLSDITEDHAAELFLIPRLDQINRYKKYPNSRLAKLFKEYDYPFLSASQTDRARKLSYAVIEYDGMILQELIDYGWVKLVCKHLRGKKDTLGLGYCKDRKNYY